MTTDTLTPVIFQRALEAGEIGCECGEKVDLESANTINEARELWNQHVRNQHKRAYE